MAKLISVVIPTYNRQQLTDRAVASVVTHHADLIEIVVVDDCGEFIYSSEPTNISGVSVWVVRLECNSGAGLARQAGVRFSTGQYIAYLDSDDTYDLGWIDHVIAMLQTDHLSSQKLIISGDLTGGRTVAKMTRKLLLRLPNTMQLVAARFVATLFNPFYTPTLVLCRELCFFDKKLRHCEDYYSTTFALFVADKILLPNVISCHLGRAPNTAGGVSSSANKMFIGEWRVRISMLHSNQTPIAYKIFLPIGMLYQVTRTGIKALLSLSKRLKPYS